MVRNRDICRFLRPDGGWITNDGNYEDIVFPECEPFTKAEYEAAKPLVQASLDKKEADEIAAKTTAEAKLAALGLTSDELKAVLLGGN